MYLLENQRHKNNFDQRYHLNSNETKVAMGRMIVRLQESHCEEWANKQNQKQTIPNTVANDL